MVDAINKQTPRPGNGGLTPNWLGRKTTKRKRITGPTLDRGGEMAAASVTCKAVGLFVVMTAHLTRFSNFQ